uniref:Uncharacterized protein n=1 Tax=Anguilla anguilla TaxID=7936 RepID=A0A0E9PKA3_ANGAN
MTTSNVLYTFSVALHDAFVKIRKYEIAMKAVLKRALTTLILAFGIKITIYYM